MQKCNEAAEATSAAWEAHAASFREKSGLLKASREEIAAGYDALEKRQNELARENEGSEVDDGDVLRINAGGRIVSVTRGTLTQLKGTRLEALFSGRWENQLLRDREGRVFLDVNPVCFRAVVDYLNELRISSPDRPPDPPHVDCEDEVFLDYLLSAFGLDELISSSQRRNKTKNSSYSEHSRPNAEQWETMTFDDFPNKIKKALEKEQAALVAAKKELKEQEYLFDQEKNLIDYFVRGESEDVIVLDVSGEMMAARRSTLGICKDSVLAKQFNDLLWTQQCNNSARSLVDEWSSEQVAEWVKTRRGIPEEVSLILQTNEIKGIELFAMRRDDFKDIGVKSGTLALLMTAIDELRQSSEPGPVFIEHSPYCFGKILDQLRLRSMCQSQDSSLPSPCIREPERKRFKTIVEYYFPEDAGSLIMGDEAMETVILTPSQVTQIRSWLEEDDISGSFELLYRATRDGWGSGDFHARCDNRGASIAIIRSTGGYIFGGFADLPWTSSSEYQASPKAFIFALANYSGLPPTKMRQSGANQGDAVYHSSSYGPTFGSGHDIHVSNNANTSGLSYLYIGSTYLCPSGQNGQTFLTGSMKFQAAEIKVFRIG